jgi:hypothetical protein
MRDSKHWPIRSWRRVHLTMLSASAAALLVAGFASPNSFIWH